MALDKLVDSTQLDADLTTVANAIRTKGGTSAQLSFPSGMAAAIADLPSGGITPSGSISITENGTYDVEEYAEAVVDVSGGGGSELNSIGFDEPTFDTDSPNYVRLKNTQFKLRGTVIPSYALTKYGQYIAFSNNPTLVVDASTITHICDYAAYYGTETAANYPNCIEVGQSAFAAGGGAAYQKLVTVFLPKVTYIRSGVFSYQRSMVACQIGSVGYGITGFYNNTFFNNVTQSGLTITLFTSGAVADGLLAAARNGATNATIIIKASEDTTYGGVSYAAGDTMITSTP